MFCILTRRTLRRRSIQGIGRTVVHAMIAMFLVSAPQVASAQTAGLRETAGPERQGSHP